MFQLTYAMHPERGTAVYIRDNLKGQENTELHKSDFLKSVCGVIWILMVI